MMKKVSGISQSSFLFCYHWNHRVFLNIHLLGFLEVKPMKLWDLS